MDQSDSLLAALKNYLALKGAVPDIKMSDTLPPYIRGQFTYGGSTRPAITLNPRTADIGTLAHELTHAAEPIISGQIFQSPELQKRLAGFGIKGQYATNPYPSIQSKALQLADPAKLDNPYRMSYEEAPAFAVDAVTSPQSAWRLGGHADSNAATEIAILLDLVTRQAQKDKK